MCGRTQTPTVTRNIGDEVTTPKGTPATIIAFDGNMAWLRSPGGRNYFRLTAELGNRKLREGDNVITAKGNPAVIRKIDGELAWVTTRRGRNVARRLDGLKAA